MITARFGAIYSFSRARDAHVGNRWPTRAGTGIAALGTSVFLRLCLPVSSTLLTTAHGFLQGGMLVQAQAAQQVDDDKPWSEGSKWNCDATAASRA